MGNTQIGSEERFEISRRIALSLSRFLSPDGGSDHRQTFAVLASLTIHFLLGTILVYGFDVQPHDASTEKRIAVTLVAPFGARKSPLQTKPSVEQSLVPDSAIESQPARDAGKNSARVPSSPKTPSKNARVPPDGGHTEGVSNMIRASRIYSDDIWSNPKNREAKRVLGQLVLSERMEQLCNSEAMEQVHNWKETFAPDWLIAYALSDPLVNGQVILADGAVFRSKGRWFHLKYECTLSNDFGTVEDMAFLVGRPVPRRDWKRLRFPTR